MHNFLNDPPKIIKNHQKSIFCTFWRLSPYGRKLPKLAPKSANRQFSTPIGGQPAAGEFRGVAIDVVVLTTSPHYSEGPPTTAWWGWMIVIILSPCTQGPARPCSPTRRVGWVLKKHRPHHCVVGAHCRAVQHANTHALTRVRRRETDFWHLKCQKCLGAKIVIS